VVGIRSWHRSHRPGAKTTLTIVNTESLFVPEHLYHRRRDIHARFGGQEQGGMITPADHKLVFLVTGSSGRPHGYEDHWSEDGSTFFYFGEGQTGDMKFTKGNLALRDHVLHGEGVHLFEEVPTKRGYLRYRGQMVCTGFALVDAPDTQQNVRKATQSRNLCASFISCCQDTEAKRCREYFCRLRQSVLGPCVHKPAYLRECLPGGLLPA